MQPSYTWEDEGDYLTIIMMNLILNPQRESNVTGGKANE